MEKAENKRTEKRGSHHSVELNKTLASRLAFLVLCASIALTTLAYGTVHPPVIALFWAGAAALIVLWAIDAWSGKAIRLTRSLLPLPLVAAGVYALLQIIPFGSTDAAAVSGIGQRISHEPYSTLLSAVQFFVLAVYLGAALVFVDSAKRLKTLVYFLIVFGFLYAFFAIIQNLLDPTRIYGVYERPYIQNPFGSFVNRHNFAAWIEMVIALPLGLLFAGAVQRERRLLFLTAIGLMGIALVMSGSRGGLLALFAEIVFIVFVARKSDTMRGFALKVGLAVALLVTIIGGTILIGGETTLTRIGETAASKDPTSSRLQIWETTWQIIKENPIFGAGFGAFGTVYTKFDPLNGRARVEQAHNDYLQILADAGIVGLILGAVFVFCLFRYGFRRLDTKDTFRRGVAVGALAGCFAILVHSIFDFVLHTTAISLVFLTLVTLATLNGRVESEEAQEKQHRSRRRKASVTPIESKRKQKELNEPAGTA